MKLYDLKAGMNPRRVRIFLAEKGVEVPMVDVDMMKGENATPEFLALNPLGKLPVLELDDGTILTESMAICRYFEELHPEPPLFGRDPLERARVEMWNRRMELEIAYPMTQVFQHGYPFWEGRITQVPAFGELCREKLRDRMAWLNDELADRDYIVGDSYTVADITAQCGLLMGKAVDMRIPDTLANLSRWFDGVVSRPTARA